jgi:uncharacterized integral membrane protein
LRPTARGCFDQSRVSEPRPRAPSTELPPTEQPRTPERRAKKGGMQRSERVRLVLTALIAALIAAFALLNLDKVEVNWIITTGRAPLIVVIALSFGAGILVDRLLRLAAKRRRR